MTLAERIIGLKPAVAISAWLASIAIASIAIEILFPLGSPQWSFGFLAFGVITLPATYLWPVALNVVVCSRLAEGASIHRKSRAAFGAACLIMIAFLALGSIIFFLPAQVFFATAALALVGGYFSLRALWLTTKALLAFENSDDGFWTFVQILYFPIGVWFLQPRLQRLLSAPALTEASFTQ